MKRANIRGPITKVADGNSSVTPYLGGPRQSIGDRNTAANDAGSYHHAGFGVSNVHWSALALAGPSGSPGVLGPQFFKRDTLGKVVVQSAIDGNDIILGPKIYCHGGRNRLLASR